MIARHRALPLSMVRASVTKGAAASRQGDYFLAVSFAARQDSDSAAKEWPPAERPIVNAADPRVNLRSWHLDQCHCNPSDLRWLR